MTADEWARRLASGAPIAEPVALVVAHPDDETLFAGTALRRFERLRVVMVTDGAPDDMADAHRLGFVSREAYAAARADELRDALVALGARAELRRYEVADQQAVLRLPAITDRLRADLAGAALVITHPYDGGHPDHDAIACAVARATRELGRHAPAVVEFACYACFAGERRFWRFVPHPSSPEHGRPLDADDAERLEAALAAHASQADVFGTLRPDAERWRAAPTYDFSRPPPGEACLYDGYGWAMTSARWRDHAAEGP